MPRGRHTRAPYRARDSIFQAVNRHWVFAKSRARPADIMSIKKYVEFRYECCPDVVHFQGAGRQVAYRRDIYENYQLFYKF